MAKKKTDAKQQPAPELENEPAAEEVVREADARDDVAEAVEQSASPPPAVDAGVEYVPDYYILRLTHDCAIGNGQRKKGEILASVRLADGIEPQEIVTALRNRRIIEFKPAAR